MEKNYNLKSWYFGQEKNDILLYIIINKVKYIDWQEVISEQYDSVF